MSARIVACRPQGDYTVWIKFADGVEGPISLARLIDLERFEPLRDVRMFMTARTHPDTGNLGWPSAGIWLDRAILHADLAARGGTSAPPLRDSTIDPSFYRFMARALAPVRLGGKWKPDEKSQ